MHPQLSLLRCRTTHDVKDVLSQALEGYRDVFPRSKTATILVKPNFNSDMNALTGNTTDLRVLAALIEFLQQSGYTNITIADGPNSGFWRSHIDVMARLRVDKLAARYGVKVLDLNHAPPQEIELEKGVRAAVARPCLEADCLINVPKLKTHFEVGLSLCVKNLMGCLVGQQEKKKAHQSLAKNLLHLARNIRPHLNIVDGLIAMEGTGPSRGTPVNMGAIVVGTDALLVDLACARLVGFDYRAVSYLRLAGEQGLIPAAYHDYLQGLPAEAFGKRLNKAKKNPLVAVIHHPALQRYFLAVRNTSVFRRLCETELGGRILFATGLRQDVFSHAEMRCDRLRVAEDNKCSACHTCTSYCPMGLSLPEGIQDERCIQCLYCYAVCPEQAIQFEGELGFFAEQDARYGSRIRAMAQTANGGPDGERVWSQ